MDTDRAADSTAFSDTQGLMRISELLPGILVNRMVGLLIAKEDGRSFTSKKDSSVQHYLVNFTLRDSKVDCINVTCWGSEQHITSLCEDFHIGDLVEICNPLVKPVSTNPDDERYHPTVSSFYQLSLSEHKSSLSLYGGPDHRLYYPMLNVPTKQVDDYYTISDILTNGQNLNQTQANIMAAVKTVGQMRKIKTRYGKETCRMEVTLFDDTAPHLSMIVWGKELSITAQSWSPKDILFGADLTIKFDEYKKMMIVSTTAKSVLTLNPDTQQAHSLYRYTLDVEVDVEQEEQQPTTGRIFIIENNLELSIFINYIHIKYQYQFTKFRDWGN